jgi:uncharacterized protein involved in exopolysaccharide biosynthesis/Mrp family chromosome partitioning ATPase
VELSYLFAAVRRRWWLVALLSVLGLAGGYLASGTSVVAYQATAVLDIQPPQNSFGSTVFISDPDRYVIGQLSVLRSSTLAERVATQFPGQTVTSMTNAVTVTHEPKSSLVTIGVTLADPKQAEAIANSYADTYITDLKKRAAEQQGPAVQAFDTRLAAIKTNVVEIERKRETNRQIVNQANLILAAPTGVAPATITEARQRLDTAMDSNSQIEGDLQSLRVEQTQVLQNKSQLEQAAIVKVVTEVVQPAVVPSLPIPGKAKILPFAGLLGGAMLGLALAMLMARMSGKAVDEQDLADALGQGIVGRLGRSADLSGLSLPNLMAMVPTEVAQVADQLCVRAEARSTDGTSLTVLVTGSARPAGTSTLAVALAARFARTGLSVVLLDADQTTAAISRQFGASEQGGIPALLARSGDNLAAVRKRGSGIVENTFAIFTPTSVHGVEVLGMGPNAGRTALRRTDVSTVLQAAMQHAHVVVIDGGALLDSASTVQLAQMVDAVVLAVPMKHQHLDELAVIADQLGAQRLKSVLPVVTSPARVASRPAGLPRAAA